MKRSGQGDFGMGVMVFFETAIARKEFTPDEAIFWLEGIVGFQIYAITKSSDMGWEVGSIWD